MPYLGKRSLANLSTCSWQLQKLVQHASRKADFTIIFGHKGKAIQEEAFKNGYSELHYPHSHHNRSPAEAIDFVPSPYTSYDDVAKFKEIVDVFKEAAEELGIDITCGYDWGFDAGHIQLK